MLCWQTNTNCDNSFGFSDIQCLLDALSVHKYLQSDCQKMLQQRVEMFKNAEEVSVMFFYSVPMNNIYPT